MNDLLYKDIQHLHSIGRSITALVSFGCYIFIIISCFSCFDCSSSSNNNNNNNNFNNNNNNNKNTILLQVVVPKIQIVAVNALVSNQPITKLIDIHKARIDTLKEICQQKIGNDAIQHQPYCNDVFYLRYCLLEDDTNDNKNDNNNNDRMIEKFQSTLEWRTSKQGQYICNAARTAIDLATTDTSNNAKNKNNKWNNEPVLQNAPHSDRIGKFISSSNAITTISNEMDLVYCIRAGTIDDVGLMSIVTVDEMIDFFLYVKEINTMVANIRSIHSNKLICIITCNDLSNVKLIGGSASFRKALSSSSTIANEIYPTSTYSGPTLLLNLPLLLSALVKLFTPLFPKSVNERLKFVQGPLSTIDNLQKIGYGYSSSRSTSSTSTGNNNNNNNNNEYSTFAKQLDEIVYVSK